MIKVHSNFTVDFLLQALKPFEHGGPSTCTREGTGNVTQRGGWPTGLGLEEEEEGGAAGGKGLG